MDQLKRQRKLTKGKLTRVKTFVDNCTVTNATIHDLTTRLENLEEVWSEYKTIQERIYSDTDDAALAVEDIDFSDNESKYLISKSNLRRLLQELGGLASANGSSSGGASPGQASTVNNDQHSSAAADVKLPRMDLPTFSGNPLDWQSYRDYFKSGVHNSNKISDVQRLHYLKNSLKGEAQELLHSIEVTDANYKLAWELLEKRYENERQLVHCHMHELFNQPKMTTESAVDLRKLMDTTTKHIRSLKTMGFQTDHWDPIMLFLISERLDTDSRRQWELSSPGKTYPHLGELETFLEQRCRALEATTTVKPKQWQKSGISQHPNQGSSTKVHHTTTNPSCPVCKNSHLIHQCNEFTKLDAKQRNDLVKKLNLCFNCLKSGHSVKTCKSEFTCRVCKRKHHTHLHRNQATSTTAETQPTSIVSSHIGSVENDYQVMLSTVVVNLKARNGVIQPCRALLDSGSQASLISEACVQRLGLQRSRSNVTISGIGQSGSGNSRGKVKLVIYSRVSDFSIDVDALILPKLTSDMPSMFTDVKNWEFLKHIKLADESFNKPGPIDLIIGADIYEEVVTDGKITSRSGIPTARHTEFGWTLSGKVENLQSNSVRVHVSTVDISSQLTQFWELEEVGDFRMPTNDEQQCETHFMKNHSRDLTGRFTVRLPFKQDDNILGASRDMCVKRLQAVERRLEKDPEHKKQYHQFMTEYLTMGHMEKIPERQLQEIPNKTNYLPHHFVLKESSTTTSLRVVFDASAKTSNGTSLNDQLLVGPTIQDDIYAILLRFRLPRYVFTADIAKMYRQVNVTETDADLQRILWRDDSSKPIEEFRLTTVTYGTASAPYLATRVLKQLAIDEGDRLPLAKEVMLRDFYVDDVMSGTNSTQSTIQTRDELIAMASSGGLQLRKWSSNLAELLDGLPPGYVETNSHLNITTDDSIKALGLRWSPTTDVFSFKVNLESKHSNITKRSILSETARLFDPLGWLAPVVILAKITFQQLWLIGVSWDDQLPKEIEANWIKFRSQLPELECLRLGRLVSGEDDAIHHLHGFSDASERAYAAAVYLKTIKTDGTTTIHLLSAKTKVAPVKKVSLPRLELCGAVLVSRLLTKVKQALNLTLTSIHAWTDSTVTLAWIRGLPIRWVTFVANRVTEIQSHVPPSSWHYVPSTDNPADCASRGLLPKELLDFSLWWTGPHWLLHEESQWPREPQLNAKTIPEQRTTRALMSQITPEWSVLARYSSLNKLKRITSYCYRFINNCRKPKEERITTPLTPQEVHHALQFWISYVQKREFIGTIGNLKKGKSIPSQLLSLAPFLDENGILRVGGRLRNSKIPTNQKHPILLPKSHHLTKLIIVDEHRRHLHSGSQLTLAAIQQNYWIVNGRSAVRQVIHKCVTCTRDRGMSSHQQMGDLPSCRVEPTTPFLKTGIDFGGPFLLKSMKGRGGKIIKSYISLFVCLSTKAIHLELVGDLTLESTIAALRRFSSRRGRPSDIYSDNATNFTGANSELRELNRLVSSHPFQDEMSTQGISWHFIPAQAPHFGGLWESGIKSVKGHLRRVIGEQSLTFEEMSTVLAQVEACLNSRPLCPLTTDPNDLSALTPGHFLIGKPLTAVADPDLSHLKINRLSRWQLVQRMTQEFWKRWHAEYLTQLQQRHKWMKKGTNIKVGDLVLIKDENACPQKWSMGRIAFVHPGKDDIVRAVTIKTSTGTITRPIVKLCLLPNDS
jgi:hypothetical protein